MYCKYCGNEVSEHAVVCIKCGAAVDQRKRVSIVIPGAKYIATFLVLIAVLGIAYANRKWLISTANSLFPPLVYKKGSESLEASARTLKLSSSNLDSAASKMNVDKTPVPKGSPFENQSPEVSNTFSFGGSYFNKDSAGGLWETTYNVAGLPIKTKVSPERLKELESSPEWPLWSEPIIK